MNASNRGGFTLVELLIVAVLGAMVALAAYQVLVTNQQTYRTEQVQIQSQQAVRAALDVLTGEIREISTSGGDLIAGTTRDLWIRRMTEFGLVCAVDLSTGSPRVTVRRVGDWFDSGDSVFIFADNDVDRTSDDTWLAGPVGQVDTTATCTGTDAAQLLTFPSMMAEFSAHSVRPGAPLRSFARFRYGVTNINGHEYLSRRIAGGSAEPLVGPLAPDSAHGIHFEYLDSLGNATAVMSDVSQIRVTLKTMSSVLNARGEPVSDSITSVIYMRN